MYWTANKIVLLWVACMLGSYCTVTHAQTATFTAEDTLRGSLNANRNWWDVRHYGLTVTPNFAEKKLTGSNTILFKRLLSTNAPMQIDLQAPMQIDSIAYHGTQPTFQKASTNTWLVHLTQQAPTIDSLTIFFSGTPREAVRPPWDGGWIWLKDSKGSPWMSAAVQGLGASSWYPCKDHQSDEPDNGANLSIVVPDSLIGVGNGQLTGISTLGNQKIYHWRVVNPINNYTIIPSIGKYVHFSDIFKGEKGKLSLDFWVLEQAKEKAQKQFQQAKLMLKAFEYWFGPYPFYKDGYKLVQTPFLGMEHQSAIAYGNGFKNGYLGRDLSGTGWGLKWDFIIIHESGHEWFANNITTKDIADMWVHEGFTNYSETLFTEYYYGKKAGNDYCYGIRKNIKNDHPIIGAYGVNNEGSGDMYSKAANMIHTIRNSIQDDAVFRKMLRQMNQQFYHQTVTTQQIESFIAQYCPFNTTPFFNQYLRTTQIPVCEYVLDTIQNTLQVRFTNCLEHFELPIYLAGKHRKIMVGTEWQKIALKAKETTWWLTDEKEKNYYIQFVATDNALAQ